jgi:hypothetical protein
MDSILKIFKEGEDIMVGEEGMWMNSPEQVA